VRGFTLIELLVVISILGILASIVIASMSGSRERARDAVRISDLQQLSLTLALYRDANGNYPQPGTSNALPPALAPTFVPALPVGPRGDTYTYAVNGNPATSYVIAAELEQDTNMPANAPSGNIWGVGCGSNTYCVTR
jgi:general secretion pathway protein G